MRRPRRPSKTGCCAAADRTAPSTTSCRRAGSSRTARWAARASAAKPARGRIRSLLPLPRTRTRPDGPDPDRPGPAPPPRPGAGPARRSSRAGHGRAGRAALRTSGSIPINCSVSSTFRSRGRRRCRPPRPAVRFGGEPLDHAGGLQVTVEGPDGRQVAVHRGQAVPARRRRRARWLADQALCSASAAPLAAVRRRGDHARVATAVARNAARRGRRPRPCGDSAPARGQVVEEGLQRGWRESMSLRRQGNQAGRPTSGNVSRAIGGGKQARQATGSAVSQRSNAASARADLASLRSRLPRTRAGRSGSRPKLAFIGREAGGGGVEQEAVQQGAPASSSAAAAGSSAPRRRRGDLPGRHQPRGDGLDVALHAGDLPGDEDVGPVDQGEVRAQQRGVSR